jgi:hypothetical protein
MRLRAFLSGIFNCASIRGISSVWRFERDSRHLTNKGIMDLIDEREIVRSLWRTQISPDPGTKKEMEVLHTRT